MTTYGNIHSVETCGTVDGPGIRYIVFTQGCLLRCQYCHNADTWEIGTGKQMSPEEIVADIELYKPFMDASGGGVTVSGGEPLLQIPFIIELFKLCKEKGIHTTIDSSAGCFSRSPEFLEQFDELLKYTDLILLDIKHIDSKRHIKLTGKPNEHILDCARYLSEKGQPVWIRHVLVPTVNDQDEYLERMGKFLGTLNNIEKVEILPYHQLGVYKWETLGYKYPLAGIQSPSDESVEHAYKMLTKYMKNVEAI